jgi:mRNA interferase MazF
VVNGPRRGDVWWVEVEGTRRPAVVLTRDRAIPVLNRVLVAPITRTIRGIPTEVPLDHADGMQHECAATFDNLALVSRSLLTERVTRLEDHRMHEVCAAYRAVIDC